MSSSILLGLYPGDRYVEVKELHNSWGTAAIVWNDLAIRYLGFMDTSAWLLPGTRQQQLWDLWKDPRVPLSHRAVLMFTFDKAYVVAMDYKRFAGDIRNYLSGLSVPAGHINHWPAIADFFEGRGVTGQLVEGLPDYPAVGLYVTTVTGNPFDGEYNEENDAPDPFDWSKVFDIYTELDGLDRKPAA